MGSVVEGLEYSDLIWCARILVLVFGSWTWVWTTVGPKTVFKYIPTGIDWVLSILNILCVPIVLLQVRSLFILKTEYNDPWTATLLAFLSVGFITATAFRGSILEDSRKYRRYMVYQQHCEAIVDLAIVNDEAAEVLANHAREQVILTTLAVRSQA
jgi:hypothetical protein